MNLLISVAFGTLVNILFLLSIFDIYFTTPIVKDVRPLESTVQPLCERLVVISVDGLRLDALFENDTNKEFIAPYIRWSMANRGTWGISQTHLPTESRPGHVAMLAGLYEDPSAVLKGWKENPVDFDSIFNRSACSFAWGSPDIVNIFFKGLVHDCAQRFVYDEKQDFAGDTKELDNWVLREVKQFFESSGNPKLYAKPKSLFFLHLLGQDTSGHTHKPHTSLYWENLRNVDRIVREVDNLFGKIFRDNATAFVLTSDHGMTDWGSHGAGDPTETHTPIVAWGKGIKHNPKNSDIVIDQADIVPLLAILLGVPIPVNSVGILPTQFLNLSAARTSEALFLNAKQIYSQFYAKKLELETESYFLAYKSFEADFKDSFESEITGYMKSGRFSEADKKILEFIETSFKGLKFYQSYFEGFLFILTSASYILWSVFLFVSSFEIIVPQTICEWLAGILVIVFLLSLVVMASLPWTYFAYTLLPIIITWQIVSTLRKSLHGFDFPRWFHKNGSFLNFLNAGALLLGTELLVVSFFYRWVITFPVLLAILLPGAYPEKYWRGSSTALVFFIATICCGFTFLPVMGLQPSPILILISSVLLSFAQFYSSNTTLPSLLLTFAILLSGFNSAFIHYHFTLNSEVKLASQIVSWLLLPLTLLFLFRKSRNTYEFLTNSLFALSIPFLCLTIAHEALFYLSLVYFLKTWVHLETSDVRSYHLYSTSAANLLYKRLSLTDFRHAFSFLTFLYLSFFGIGNLATINSFDPAWVRSFITTFSPFVMTALILVKVIVPFFAVTLTMRALTVLLDIEMRQIFIPVLLFCNLMGLNFLYLVKNEGSWLEIGTSLSHYVIQQVTIVFVIVLFGISSFVIPMTGPSSRKSHFF